MDDEALANLALYVALELVLGCLDPMVIQSSIGELLRQRLNEIAGDLGLPGRQLRGRELPERDLKLIFAHVLS